ncbi:MAG: hypothetical protein AB8B69_15840, partial [Chitinophagales bacterium]
MKSTYQYVVLILAFLLLSGFDAPEDEQAKKDALLALVIKNIKTKHYKAAVIDDDFSEKVFNKYLKTIDRSKRLLLANDVKSLKRFKDQLDDEIRQNDRTFFELSLVILQKRLEMAGGVIETTLAQPFDFEKKDFLEASSKKRNYAKNEKEWKENWRQYLKYETLRKLNQLITDQEESIEAGNKTIVPKSTAVLEEEARAKVLKAQKKWHKGVSKKTSLSWFHAYLQSITNVFDPHTVFMPPKSRKSFETSLRGSMEGIGATLREKNGKITIVGLTPGGPAAKQGELKPEDAILK